MKFQLSDIGSYMYEEIFTFCTVVGWLLAGWLWSSAERQRILSGSLDEKLAGLQGGLEFSSDPDDSLAEGSECEESTNLEKTASYRLPPRRSRDPRRDQWRMLLESYDVLGAPVGSWNLSD